MILPKQYWNLGFPEDNKIKNNWYKSLQNLDSGYLWVIDSTINNLFHFKHPWKIYKKYNRCNCCESHKNTYLLDVTHKGIGNKTVLILVIFNKQKNIVTPLYYELI